MKKKVYIETTIPSFYYEERTQPVIMIAQREQTRKWWDTRRQLYELVVGAATVEELRRGKHPLQESKLQLISEIPVIHFTEAVERIVDVYIANKLMPNNVLGDALHLALASLGKCDFLLTWNCNHLANANKFEHIRRINTRLGLFVPTITTPIQLMSLEGVKP